MTAIGPQDTNVARGDGLGWLYAVEALQATAGTFMSIGIFFYTKHHFHWSLTQNLLLAVGQGLVYVVGALLADPLVRRWGRRRVLTGLNIVLAGITLVAAFFRSPPLATLLLISYSFTISAAWPALESLISGNAAPEEMSRRIGLYNSIWSFLGAAIMAVAGTIIAYLPRAFFLIPAAVHLASAVVMYLLHRAGRNRDEVPAHAEGPHAETALLAQRRLALWLSRIALPSTYVVIFSLMATMPSLPVVQRMSVAYATLLSSAWLVARWLIFWLLSVTAWWHTRPRLLLGAAAFMLIAFLAVTLAGLSHSVAQWPVLAMVIGQIVLGATIGLIYSASLYFGMVLSAGSTEHGGYHEALIGLGQALGPALGVAAAVVRPGDIRAGILAVAGVLAVSVAAATVASIRLRQKS